jgi:B9 domain-containing protein 2
MDNPPRLTTLAPLSTDQGDFALRKVINSISSGKVILEMEVQIFLIYKIKVLMKNFRNVGLSG